MTKAEKIEKENDKQLNTIRAKGSDPLTETQKLIDSVFVKISSICQIHWNSPDIKLSTKIFMLEKSLFQLRLMESANAEQIVKEMMEYFKN